MHCSACKRGSLVPSKLDDLFNAHRCNHCGGHWVLISEFAAWQVSHPNYEYAAVKVIEESEDSPMALFCPVSSTLMRKFNIRTNATHRLDYSATVGGVWLDKSEWPLLESDDLLSCLNLLATDGWQINLKQCQTELDLTDHYRSQFGDETYTELKRLHAWLVAQPNCNELRQYLLADDPYRIKG